MHKKFFLIALLFLVTCTQSPLQHSELTSGYYVFPKAGLNLRSEPNIYSKSLALLPRGTKVEVIEKSSQSALIEEIPGSWWKVKSSNKIGYVFSGYVSRYKPPKTKCSSLIDYLKEIYGELNEKNPKVKNYTQKKDPSCDTEEDMGHCEIFHSFKIEPDKIEVSYTLGYEWLYEQVFFPNMHDTEGFLLLHDCCQTEKFKITYSQYRNMLDKGIPIPAFQTVYYLNCKVKRKQEGIMLGTESGL